MIESIFGKIAAIVAVPVLFISSLFSPQVEAPEPVIEVPVYVDPIEEPELGVALPQVAAVFETSLAAPITAAATSMTLTANSVRGGGSLSGFNCFTIDEGSAQSEFVCGTASGTAVTGLDRGISPIDGITEDTDLQFAHRRGSNVKITDFPLIQRVKSQNNGEGTFANVLSYASGVTPSGGSEIADVEYVLATIAGTSTLGFDKQVVAGNAGETVVAGQLLYLLNTDAEWYKVDTDTESTVNGRLLGIAQGAGTNGNSITGGVMLSGLDTNQSGLTTGTYYYASTSAGGIGSTVTGRVVGQAKNTTNLYFNPSGIASSTAQLRFANTYTSSNSFTATSTFTGPTNLGIKTVKAGATINGATTPVPVYQNKTDNEFYAVDGNATGTRKFLGFAISNGTDGNNMNVQFSGIVNGFTGLDEGEKYYVQDAVGTIGTSIGTYQIFVGVAVSPTQLMIQKGLHRGAGSALLVSSTNGSTVVNLGFRPSVIRMQAYGHGSSNSALGSVMSAVWADGTLIGGSAYNDSAPSFETQLAARLQYDLSNPDYFAFTVTSVTDTGFTITWTETGTGPEGVLIWDAEGEL